jgi:DNA/RNA-binding domain of Phe-tRNA-synthetase-like protein
MIQILLSDSVKNACPNIALGAITGKIKIAQSSDILCNNINDELKRIENSIKIDDIKKIAEIIESRKAYKALGKEPSRYRLSAEALLRRTIQGKGLYFINNVVDVINLVSLQSHYSIGLYDLSRLYPPVIFTTGTKEDIYESIGKGVMNIENLPVFADEAGKFGSPTNDSDRAKITNETKEILVVIIDFNYSAKLDEAVVKTIDLLNINAALSDSNYKIIFANG